LSKVETATLSFNAVVQSVGNEVVIDHVVFWDGSQNHTIYTEAGGLLIPELKLPFGTKIGATSITLRNTIHPSGYPMTTYCEVYRNGILHADAEKKEVPGGYAEYGPRDVPDWVMAKDEKIDLKVGFKKSEEKQLTQTLGFQLKVAAFNWRSLIVPAIILAAVVSVGFVFYKIKG